MLIIIDVDHANQGRQGFCKGPLKPKLCGHSASLSGEFVIMSIKFCFFATPKTMRARNSRPKTPTS